MCFRCYITELHTPVYLYFLRDDVRVLATHIAETRTFAKKGAAKRGLLGRAAVAFARKEKETPRVEMASTRGPPFLFFFLLSGMMAPHAKSSRNTPTSRSRSYHSRHGTPVRFVRLSTEPEHTLDRTSLKMHLSLFPPRCVSRFWHEPYAEEIVLLPRDKPYCSDLGRAR